MRFLRPFVFTWACLLVSSAMWAANPIDSMKVTLLGTGTPYPDADRFGSAVLVEAAGKKLLFDCGRGVVTRLHQAGINPADVDGVFLTHLHSDHVVGLPDLWLTGWFLGREQPLRIWGPPGTQAMGQHLALAFRFDVQVRESGPDALPPAGAELEARDIRQSTVYDDGGLRVSAFAVDHGLVKPALGYRIDYAGHSVVISGDTRFSENLIEQAKGTDCLIHAAWATNAKNPTPEPQRSIASAEDAARVFAAAKPKLAVIVHYKDSEGMADAVRKIYNGPFVIGQDLMVIEIGQSVTWHVGK